MDKKSLDMIRDIISKVNRVFTQQGKPAFWQIAPVKTEQPEVQDPPPQITGTRNKKNISIPGTGAGNDKISGSSEAGGGSPVI